MSEQQANDMERILEKLVTAYHAQGEDAVRTILKSMGLPDDRIEEIMAEVKRRDEAEQVAMVQLVTAYRMDGEGTVRDMLSENPPDVIEQVMAEVKRRAKTEPTYETPPQNDETDSVWQQIIDDYREHGETVVRDNLQRTGLDDDHVDAIIAIVKRRIDGS